jgi:hypothetical protein
MTDKENRPVKPSNQPEKPGSSYPVTYWVYKPESIAVVRVNDITIQGWKANGRDLSLDFEHSHFQTIYPCKERLDEYLSKFDPSTVEEYLEYQFAQHQLDDHFREKANLFKNKLAQK